MIIAKRMIALLLALLLLAGPVRQLIPVWTQEVLPVQ